MRISAERALQAKKYPAPRVKGERMQKMKEIKPVKKANLKPVPPLLNAPSAPDEDGSATAVVMENVRQVSAESFIQEFICMSCKQITTCQHFHLMPKEVNITFDQNTNLFSFTSKCR
jgi:hypothetical protein